VKFWNFVKSFFLFALRQIFPFAIAAYLDWTLGRRITAQRQTVELTDEMNQCFPLDLDELKEAHQLEIDRREQLRKNAQLNLGASTLATTIAFALSKQDAFVVLNHWSCVFFAACAVFYLSATALSALRACDTMAVNDLWLQFRVYPFGQDTVELDKKAKLIKSTFLNQAGNLIVANYAEASSIGMRNAIVAIGYVLIAGLAINADTAAHPQSNKPTPTQSPPPPQNQMTPLAPSKAAPAGAAHPAAPTAPLTPAPKTELQSNPTRPVPASATKPTTPTKSRSPGKP
jgi:hypothetical protein